MAVAGGVLSGVIQKAIASSGDTATTPAQSLDKDDFLRLLTTQLRNQDPLNPISNADFIAQTAQFSSLEQLQKMNGALERLTGQMGGSATANAAALLGRVVTVNGTPVGLEAGRPVNLGYSLAASASSAVLVVQDGAGKVVRTMQLGQKGRGPHQVAFDGRDDQGRLLPSGSYVYRLVAVDGTGRVIPGTITGAGQVTGINVEDGQVVLMVGDQRVPWSNVVGVVAGTLP
jgi:flagellar basal-body rod modification protein FlgD